MKQSSTSLPSGTSRSRIEPSASECDDNDSLLEEVEAQPPPPPEPTEEPDPVLADRRHPPLVQDYVTTLLLNAMLETVVDSWEGVPTMRPILKRASLAVDETLVQEQLDVVPESIHPSSPARSHKFKKQSSSTSVVGVKNKKKTSKTQVDRSVVSVVEEDSPTKTRRQSFDKKKRRTSKERKLHRGSDESHRDEKSGAAGDESGGEAMDETKTKASTPDVDGLAVGSGVDLPPEVPDVTIDSWQIHFSDEKAEVMLKNGSHYEGRISRKLMEGDGVFTWADGTQYQGELVAGEVTGRGKMTWPDTSRYEGEFVKGWRYGRGLYVSSFKKLAYIGTWVKGRKHGKGLIFYNEDGSDMYDGEWSNDQREGYGLRYYPSGARYLGDWKQGLKDGVGTMVFANGDVYSGNWEKGFMNGYGEYIWEAYLNNTLAFFGENIYCGWFANGKRMGESTYQLKGGQYVHGEWNTDVKEGTARVVCGDGSVYVGSPMFEDDRPVSRKIETKPSTPSKDLSVLNHGSKIVPHMVRNPKTGKLEVSLVHQPQKRRSSLTKMNSYHISKPPPPKPSMILHGYYLPVYAPFQCIDLCHHLALLRELKHRKVSTGCQTDDDSLTADSRIHRLQESLEEKCESKAVDPNTKAKFKYKHSPNEHSTQTEESWIAKSKEAQNEEEITATLEIDNSTNTSSKNASKKLKGVGLNEPHQNSVKAPQKKSLDADKIRKCSYLHKSSNRWPHRPKVTYPSRLTEVAYEHRWLRRTIMVHLPAIRRAYEEYARLCYEGQEQPSLLRLTLWQFYRDCKVTTRISLVELDRMMESNRDARVASAHCPFERITLWQFLYSLVDVAWKLYASQGLGHPGSKGVLGSAFTKLMHEDMLCRLPVGSAGSVLTRHRDLLPLAPVYLLYRSLGEPLSARRLLQETCTRTGVEPRPPPPRKIAHYPHFWSEGVNAFVLGGDLTFLPQKPPLSCVETASYEETTATALSIFKNVGVAGVTNILVEICPRIKEAGSIVNMGYEITFLEFYEALLKCEGRSAQREERRLARLAALEKSRLEMLEAKRSQEIEKVDLPIALATKVGRTKQKKPGKSKA